MIRRNFLILVLHEGIEPRVSKQVSFIVKKWLVININDSLMKEKKNPEYLIIYVSQRKEGMVGGLFFQNNTSFGIASLELLFQIYYSKPTILLKLMINCYHKI